MVVITGPFDFRTTSRLDDMPLTGFRAGCCGSASRRDVSVAESGVRPARTLTAPIIAERIMKARRSTPPGSSPDASSSSGLGVSSGGELEDMSHLGAWLVVVGGPALAAVRRG